MHVLFVHYATIFLFFGPFLTPPPLLFLNVILVSLTTASNSSLTGFPPGMFQRGVQKGWGVWGSSPRRCLKWHILTEMTVKYEIYFYFLCQQGGDIPPVVLSGGVRTPPTPGGNPALTNGFPKKILEIIWVAHVLIGSVGNQRQTNIFFRPKGQSIKMRTMRLCYSLFTLRWELWQLFSLRPQGKRKWDL